VTQICQGSAESRQHVTPVLCRVMCDVSSPDDARQWSDSATLRRTSPRGRRDSGRPDWHWLLSCLVASGVWMRSGRFLAVPARSWSPTRWGWRGRRRSPAARTSVCLDLPPRRAPSDRLARLLERRTAYGPIEPQPAGFVNRVALLARPAPARQSLDGLTPFVARHESEPPFRFSRSTHTGSMHCCLANAL